MAMVTWIQPQLGTCKASIDWILTGIAYTVITGDNQTVTDFLRWALLQIPLSPPSAQRCSPSTGADS